MSDIIASVLYNHVYEGQKRVCVPRINIAICTKSQKRVCVEQNRIYVRKSRLCSELKNFYNPANKHSQFRNSWASEVISLGFHLAVNLSLGLTKSIIALHLTLHSHLSKIESKGHLLVLIILCQHTTYNYTLLSGPSSRFLTFGSHLVLLRVKVNLPHQEKLSSLWKSHLLYYIHTWSYTLDIASTPQIHLHSIQLLVFHTLSIFI